MHRVYVPPETLDQPVISLSDERAHYIARVLRLRGGDEVGLFDGSGREWLVRLTRVSAGLVQGERVRLLATPPPCDRAGGPLPVVVLGQGLPQGAKMDWIVEKCSELGLSTLVPLHTELSAVRSVGQRINGRMARWHRIAAAAAGQCGRRTLLELGTPSSLADFCARYDAAAVKIICWEHEKITRHPAGVGGRGRSLSRRRSWSGRKAASPKTKSAWPRRTVLCPSAWARGACEPKPRRLP